MTASDGTAPVDTATVNITVTDVDDSDPVFGQDVYTGTVAENSAAGTVVATVAATDADGDTLTYAITGGSGVGLFVIDPETGAISVAAGAELDADGEGRRVTR